MSFLFLRRLSFCLPLSVSLPPFLSPSVSLSLLPAVLCVPLPAASLSLPLLPLSTFVSCSLCHCLSPWPLYPLQPARASLSPLDHVSSFLVFPVPGTVLTPGPAVPITWSPQGLGWGGRHGHRQGPVPLLLAPGPLPSYAADTSGPQRRPVPILRVSHADEEGEDGWTHGAWAGGAQTWAGSSCMQGTCVDALVHTRGSPALPALPRGLGLGSTNLAGPSTAPITAPPTVHAGQVPPEDDEYEYSEYSVEDYQDPEAPWGADGENAAGPRGSRGGAGRAVPADLSLTPGPL